MYEKDLGIEHGHVGYQNNQAAHLSLYMYIEVIKT